MLFAAGTRLALSLDRLGGRKLVRRGRFGSTRSRGRRWRKRAQSEQRDFETKRETCGVGICKRKRVEARVKAHLFVGSVVYTQFFTCVCAFSG